MMERGRLIGQLIFLKSQYDPDPEDVDSKLFNRFDYELTHNEVAWIEMDGRIVAFCDWSWISSLGDTAKVRKGEPTSGDILFVISLVVTERNLLWPAKQLLPKHRWIAWKGKDGRIHTPKGIPHAEEAVA